MHRVLAIAVMLLALGTTGCNDGGGGESSSAEPDASPPRAGLTPAVEPPSTRALARLQTSLDDRYSATAIAPADLPQTKPLFRRPGGRWPAKLQPIDGLRAQLADGTTGHVFRYESKGLARRAAASFLRRNLFHGVQGCDHTIFFSGSHGAAGQQWQDDVGSGLNCAGGFAVIE